MNFSQNQFEVLGQRDVFGQRKSDRAIEKDVLFIENPGGSPSDDSSLSSLELRIPADENGRLCNRDTRKGVKEVTEDYKYASSPPDGGLKAWSVVAAYVPRSASHCG